MDNRKHVYILGAGFSVPLGGPLFTQLLTAEMRHYIATLQLPNALHHAIGELHYDPADVTHRSIESRLYRVRRPYDAEELLELIDWAERHVDSQQATAILEATSPGRRDLAFNKAVHLARINICLRRVIACQCEAFLNDLEPDSERLEPYKAWFAELSSDDTIVTFNYDTTIERVAELVKKPLPREPGSYRGDQPQLIKLHGSADWFYEGNEVKYAPHAYRRDVKIAIGMPGRGKANLGEHTVFKSLWQSASVAISNAHYVSIIGYSMPATDNRARKLILDSIANRQGRSHGPRVNIVLGPATGTVTARRMVSMIRPLVNDMQKVVDTSLYAQDYIEQVAHYHSSDYFAK